MSSSTPARSWNRLDGVDLLRGLAIFFVLMNHIHIRLLSADVSYAKYLPNQLVHFLVWNGQLGVQMFFVVSGFLITSISLRRWSPLSRIRLRDFYILRFARIAPLLLALLALLSSLHFADLQHFVVSEKTGGLPRALLAALTFHVNVLEAHRGYLPANWDILWSLSVEEMFYLFFPLVALFLGRSKWFVALLLVFVALGPFGRTIWARGNEVWSEYCYLGGMEGIAIGCLTALFVSRIHLSRSAVRTLGILGTLIVSCSLIFSWQAYRGWLGSTGLNMTVLGLGTALFIAATTQAHWHSPHLLFPLLRIGQYSYEVYLTHMFVVWTFFALFLKAGSSMRLVPPLFLITILLAGLLGFLISRYYSEPLNRNLRNHFHDGPSTLGSALESAPSSP
ncbi:MAG TPA: acyltransferase [Verrucomicrobiae bacterium]|nr:acyltransferase [Verrucomicrobiae bacterium]